MNAQAKDRALYALIIDNLGSGHSVAEAMQKNRDRAMILHEHARTLRRAQMTLHRWAEEMCNGTIQRDGEQGDGKPYRYGYMLSKHPVPDREAGALRRVEQVCKAAGLFYYHQTDPRGCALYVSALDQSNYDHGIACL